jgi:hypothetical protein
MTIATNTFLTFSAIGNREDLLDKITNISPTDVPFQSMAGETTASATLHEWQTDALAAAAANAQLQGDEFSYNAVVATARVSNRTQIARKSIIVSGTQEAVDKAGRNSEMVYQTSKMRDELKRDKEFILLSNQAPVTGNSTTAPQLRPLASWLTTNVQAGTGAANGSSSTARTDGTQAALTLAMVNTAQQTAWLHGGKPGYVLCGPVQRQNLTTVMGGAATKYYAVEDKVMTATIQAYEGDFGMIKIVTDRFIRGGQTSADREIYLLDPDLVNVSYLTGRKMKTFDVAPTGDATKGVILSEFTLEVRQEAGLAGVFDLT